MKTTVMNKDNKKSRAQVIDAERLKILPSGFPHRVFLLSGCVHGIFCIYSYKEVCASSKMRKAKTNDKHRKSRACRAFLAGRNYSYSYVITNPKMKGIA